LHLRHTTAQPRRGLAGHRLEGAGRGSRQRLFGQAHDTVRRRQAGTRGPPSARLGQGLVAPDDREPRPAPGAHRGQRQLGAAIDHHDRADRAQTPLLARRQAGRHGSIEGHQTNLQPLRVDVARQPGEHRAQPRCGDLGCGQGGAARGFGRCQQADRQRRHAVGPQHVGHEAPARVGEAAGVGMDDQRQPLRLFRQRKLAGQAGLADDDGPGCGEHVHRAIQG
jgi:hypothetical protein